jgi:hypothetical protein
MVDGDAPLLARTQRRLLARLGGKSLPIASIAEPQAFAPTRLGVFFLQPLSEERVSLDYTTVDGARKSRLLSIDRSGRDLTVDASGKLLRWSRVEQSESDLMLTRLD